MTIDDDKPRETISPDIHTVLRKVARAEPQETLARNEVNVRWECGRRRDG